MITFSGTLPKLTQYLSSENLRGLDEEVEDFLWKLKMSSPNLIFVFGSDFSNKIDKEDESFTFFPGDNFRYLKDKDVWPQLLTKIQSYDVEKVHCSLKEQDIRVLEQDIFLKRFLDLFNETNIIFIEYPLVSSKDVYEELGRLLAKAGEIEGFNVAFLSYGHLSSVLDKTKIFYNGQAEEVDNIFIDHLKADVFSVFSTSYYQHEHIVTRQNLYEGILIAAAAIYDKSVTYNVNISKGFDLIASPVINGTHYLSCILHKDNPNSPDYEREYSLEEYAELLIRSKIMGFEIDESKVKLQLSEEYKQKGLFLSLFVDEDNISCFGNPDIDVRKENALQILKLFVDNLISVSRRKIKIQDLLKSSILITTSSKGFNFFEINEIKDIVKYDILAFRKKDGTEYCYHLKNKTVKGFIRIFNDLNIKDDPEVFGLK